MEDQIITVYKELEYIKYIIKKLKKNKLTAVNENSY